MSASFSPPVALVDAVADQQRAGAVGDPGDELVADRVDGDEHADRHAPLAGAAVAGVDGRVGGEVEVGVGQDDHVVLRAAEGLDALAVAARGLVDVLRDRGRADEADRLHVGAGQQRVDGGLVAVQHVEDAVGETGLLPERGEPVGRARVLLAGLEHHGVAGRDGDGEEPHRDHRGEVERADDADHAERDPLGVHVDAGGRLLAVAALEQVGDAAGELDDLEAAGDLADGVGVHLAVLGGDDRGELVLAAVEQLAEGEHHLRTPRERGGAPAAGGAGRRVDDLGRVGLAGQRDAAGDLAGGGVGDVGPADG